MDIITEKLKNGVIIQYKKNYLTREERYAKFYGDTTSYIHFKFGDCIKMYNFTKEFLDQYTIFCKGYQRFFNGKPSRLFKKGVDVVRYIKENNIPILLYQNYHDLEFLNVDEAIKYLENYDTKEIT